ncbi:protein ORANGE-LIKE, chloroplastic isoform X2 [Durio zibethinus]|uniref:Protein ORANGE-LIKE, chloroplastic isoform X2 n=1 Tax=Durio zibethinus TaxID=66656 RepID=A0A6P6AMI7_DURZI|nr:protein ORANGE-LIKE, chloroplastic isoform X2 [Durio zibethinus]
MGTFHLYSHHHHHLLLPTTSPPNFKTRILFNGNRKFLSSPKHSSPSPLLCFSSKSNPPPSGDNLPSNFCIIEGPETVQDFVKMQLQEIEDNIRSRRSKIFLLMEEVRRLRIQQRIKKVKVVNENGDEDIDEMPDIPSSIPFFSYVLTPKTMKQLYFTSLAFISGIIVFGGLIAPTLELKLGLGGTSYEDFIRNMHLPLQLSQVDPIVASFSGGAVGVISALMLIEANNVEQQEKKRCKYCHGNDYLKWYFFCLTPQCTLPLSSFPENN